MVQMCLRITCRQMKTEAARQTTVLQAWLAERLGTRLWFGGETFGWADARRAYGQSFGAFLRHVMCS